MVTVQSLEGGIKILWHGCGKADGSGAWKPQKRANSTQWYTQVIEEACIIRFGMRMRKNGSLHKRAFKALMQEVVNRKMPADALPRQL